MGTSGAYGGSGSSSWDAVHTAYADMTGPSTPPPTPQQVDKFVSAVLKALSSGASGGSPGSVGSLLPTRPAAGGSRSSASSTGAGGGGRSISRQAARGAAAVAGAYAVRTGDAAALRELGLDLEEVRSLPSIRAQCAYIADRILGAPSHPDEVALKAATLRTMAELMRAPQELDIEARVDLLIENLAYEQVLVELTSQRRENVTTPERAMQIEEQARKYLHAHVAAGRVAHQAKVTVQGLVDYAAKLAAKTFRVLGLSGGKT